jgi:excisionase family DNA binding protein
MMRDQDFGIVRLRAFGTYDFKVVEPRLFLREVVGTDQNFRLDEFADTMRSRLVSVFTDSLATAKVPALDVASRYQEVGDALLPVINPQVGTKYGIEISSFILENVSVPPEVEEAIDKRSSMSAIGNLNDYVKYQMGQGMAKGGGGGGPGGAAAEMAIGFGMAQEMMKQNAAGAAASATTTSPSAGAAAQQAAGMAADLMDIPTVARYLGVSEADVMASITAGELKAKKIGAQYRVTKAALDGFLAQ